MNKLILLLSFFMGIFSLPANCLSAISNSTLNGQYIAVHQEADTDDKEDSGCRSLWTFDGDGKGTMQFLECMGAYTGESESFTYNVSPDGTFIIAGSDPVPVHGIISEDGEIGILSIIEEPVDDVTLFVFVKKSLGMSNSKYKGDYITVTQNTYGGGARILGTADGKGNATYKRLESNDADLGSGNITYNVSSDGTSTFTVPDIFTSHGIMSSDGKISIAFINGDGFSEIGISIQKSSGMSNSKLEGEYIFVAQNTDYEGIRMLVTFDGKGSGTYQHLESVYSGPDSGTFTYKVSSDGTYTLSPEGFVTGKGIVSSDGTVATLIFFEEDFTELQVGLRKSTYSGTDNDGDGYTTDQGDCNDNNKSIHPGAAEICGDGIDQDCDGIDKQCIVANIKANDSDGPINIASADNLSIKIEIAPGGFAGENSDWWLVEAAPSGLSHYLPADGSWAPGLTYSHQGPLFNLGEFEVLNISGLPIGSYTFYFGVDMDMNGTLDMGQAYYDSVTVNVQ